MATVQELNDSQQKLADAMTANTAAVSQLGSVVTVGIDDLQKQSAKIQELIAAAGANGINPADLEPIKAGMDATAAKLSEATQSLTSTSQNLETAEALNPAP